MSEMLALPTPEETGIIERHYKGDVSLVIRVRNEERNLGRLFDILEDQTVTPQVIVVDNDSSDRTRQLAIARGAVVVNIAEAAFSYPKASNLGVARADGELVTLLSAHSFPRRNDWLEIGAMHFQNPQVAGVYCHPIPRRDSEASLTDKLLSPIVELTVKAQGVRVETKPSFGILGATNTMLRRELLRERSFDEKYGLGGEDRDWAIWALGKGFVIINDNRFTVYHSHSLGPLGWTRQYMEWRNMTSRPFDRSAIAYRRNEN